MKKFKKTGKMLLCLSLVLSMTAGLLVLRARQSWTSATLGDLSQYYEIGSISENVDAGIVSTVKGDSGGTSFGIYMFASASNTPYKFAEWLSDSENSVYATIGTALCNAYNYNSKNEYYPGYGSNFTNTWKLMAETYTQQFYQAQKDYWQSAYYNDLVSRLETTYSGLKVSDYSIALKNVIWSRSVQHGVNGAYNVITRAMDELGGFKYQPEAELISAIYAESGKLTGDHETKMTSALANKYGMKNMSLAYYSANSGAVQESVYRRLRVNEPHDALTMLYQKRSGSALFADGAYILKDNANQSRYLTANGTVSADTEVDNKMVLTWYDGGFYTITCGAKRLTGSESGAAFADPAVSSAQFWEVAAAEEGGHVLKNRATGTYLTIAAENGTLGTTADLAAAARWQFSAQGTVYLRDLVAPGAGNNLTEGNASFPLRGILTSAVPLTNVNIKVRNANNVGVANCSPSKNCNSNYFDLWELDGACSFSKLPQGSYTLGVYATVQNGSEVQVGETLSFTVGAPVDTEEPVVEEFTITFDAAGGACSESSRVYSLGDVYGELPEPTHENGKFVGWFLNDEQVVASSPVAAEDHTLVAKYGDLYTVTFQPNNGGKDTVLRLGEGDLIKAPASPIKAADSEYSYSFSHWETTGGGKFAPNATFMGKADVVYTAVYNKTTITAGTTPPSTTPDPSVPTQPTDGGYLSGLAPKTKVSELASAGYTVYDGDEEVTSGNVGTGMTAISGNTSFTIVVTGDVSGDGKVTITDVVKLQSAVVGKSQLSGAYEKAADVSGDGKFTITDVVQTAQYTVGKRDFN